ncbi:MAG: PRTRC system protein C [Vulcanimicrobiaceae bacterium]
MKVTTPKRIINFDGRKLADLKPAATIDAVIKMHATTIPELATAVAEGPTYEDGNAIYTVATRLGKNG